MRTKTIVFRLSSKFFLAHILYVFAVDVSKRVLKPLWWFWHAAFFRMFEKRNMEFKKANKLSSLLLAYGYSIWMVWLNYMWHHITMFPPTSSSFIAMVIAFILMAFVLFCTVAKIIIFKIIIFYTYYGTDPSSIC